MKKFVIIIFLLTITVSQSQIQGVVYDSNGETIPYVNIFIENSYVGTSSNAKGEYEINIKKKGNYTVVYQFLGYKTLKNNITVNEFPFKLNVVLEDENISLNEVIISSEENPANRIIKKAISKRLVYLEKLNKYTADFYSKGYIKIENAPEKFMGQELGDLGGSLDSTRSGYIYLSETISKIEYIKPEMYETVIASKVSGDSNGISFNSAMDVDFNLYNNTVNINNEIISPISDYAFNYYKYKLEGDFYDTHGNLINKIKIIPKRENDRVFSGSIYIVEESWAIYGVDIQISGAQAQILPAENIRIRQNLSFEPESKFWLLKNQSIDFGYGIFGFKGSGSFIANYSNYDLKTEISSNKKKNQILTFDKNANNKENRFWENERPIPLTEDELKDYIKKDSIETKRSSKVYLDSVDLKNNKFKLVDLVLGYQFNNSYEKKYIGITGPLMGLSFNTVQGYNISVRSNYTKLYNEYKNFISFNGLVNYSVESDRIRGKLFGKYKFNAINNAEFRFDIGSKTEQFNSENPITKLQNSISSLLFEKNYMKIYDKAYIDIGYSRELFNGLFFKSNLIYEDRKVLFNNTDFVILPRESINYTSNNPLNPNATNTSPFINHDIIKFNIGFGISFGEKFMSYPDFKVNIENSKYPKLFLEYTKGFNSSISNYNFDHLNIRINQELNLKSIGVLNYNYIVGTFFKNKTVSFVDYKHFNGNQTNINSRGNYISSFKNLEYYDYSTSNDYFEYHLEQNFKGYVLGKIPFVNKFNFNLVLGAHGISISKNKNYFEFNSGISNLGWGKYRFLRIDYVRSYSGGKSESRFMFGINL